MTAHLWRLGVAALATCSWLAVAQPDRGAIGGPAGTGDRGSGTESTVSEDEQAGAEQPSVAALLERALPVEIDTASYFELLQRVRELGLPDNGGRGELQARLRTYFGIQLTLPESQPVGRIILIESAQFAEYFTVEEVDESYVRLRGGVVVTVDDRETDERHVISADEVVYNQATESLTARGSVEYRLVAAGGEEVFRGEALRFDVATTEGAFVSGSTERDHFTGTDTITFRFAGDEVVRLADDTIVLQQGQITSSPDTDAPNYEIRAREMWILAPSEWALRGATLFVGRIPVFYLPFFFRAGDELIFHPSIEVDDQRGTVLNTTTYLIGRREQPDTPFSFLRTTDDTQYDEVRAGLFLRKVPSVGRPEAGDADGSRFLKVMVDLYSRFGAFAGAEAALETDANAQLFFKGGIGASRTIYFDSQLGFTPFFVDTNGDVFSIWHDVNLFGGVVPLRYALDASLSLTGSPADDSLLSAWSLAAGVEWFSDPRFTADFYNRQERIDWPALIGLPGDMAPVVAVRSTLTWEVNARGDLRLRDEESATESGAVLVERLSFPTLNARLFWQSRQDSVDYCAQLASSFGTQAACDVAKAGWAIDGLDPTTEFYYPSTLRLPMISMSMAGTLLRAPMSPEQVPAGESDVASAVAGRGLRRQRTKGPTDDDQRTAESSPLPTLRAQPLPMRPVVARADAPSPLLVEPFTATVSYDLTPTITVEETFDSGLWTTPTAVDFSQRYVTAQLMETARVVGDITVQGGLFTARNILGNSATYQTRFARGASLLDGLDSAGADDGGAEDDSVWDSLIASDLTQTGVRVSAATRLTLLPLRQVPALAASSLVYDIGLGLYEVAYDAAKTSDLAAPVYVTSGPQWNAEGVDQHSFESHLALLLGEHTQSLTLAASLPPANTLSISASLSLASSLVSGSLATTVSPGAGASDPAFDWQPLRAAVDFRIAERISIRQELDTDLQLLALDRASTTLTLADFSGTAVGRYMVPLDPNGAALGGEEDKEFLLQQLQFGYSLSPEPLLLWRNRIKLDLGLRTAWQINLQDFVNNAFTFDFSLYLSIHEFLELGLTTSSRNDQTYRYLPGLPEKVGEVWINPLQDLWWSFQFWNPGNRILSAFNLQTLSLSLVHDLVDWNLSFKYTGSYEPNSTGTQLEWSPTFSLSVQWIPVPEISSEISGGDVLSIGD